MTAHCRIGRVTMKAGGAEVRVLRRPVLAENGAELIEHARILAGGDRPINFVALSWTDDGAYSMGARLRNESAIPLTLLPAWVAEAVRRELVTSRQVRQIVDAEYVTPQGPAS